MPIARERRLQHGLLALHAKLAPLQGLDGPRDVGMVVRVIALAVAVPLVVRLPLPRQAALLDRPLRSTRRRQVPAADVERVVRCVEAAQSVGSPLVRRGCLTRGMVLYWLLGRADAEIELCFGLGHVDGQLSGHCWLSRGGRPYLERVDATESFEVIYRIPVPVSP